MRSSEENPNMNSTIDSYFATVRQIAAERGGTYSHGTTWAAVDSTRDGERVVAEAGFYTSFDGSPYFALEIYEYDGDTADDVDGLIGTDPAELYRKMGQWV